MIIFRALNWLACLGLRFTAWASNRLHQSLKSGPKARIWLATDDELLMEVRKRGLKSKKKPSQAQNPKIIQMTRTTHFSDYEGATVAVMTLQEVPKSKARSAVDRAVLEFQNDRRLDPQIQDVIQKALKYA